MEWEAVLIGSDGTIWEGGVFKLVLKFSHDYPNKAPEVKFVTKMYHPNSKLFKNKYMLMVLFVLTFFRHSGLLFIMFLQF